LTVSPLRHQRLLAWLLLLVLIAGWTAAHAGTALVVAVPLQAPDVIVSLASHEWERLPETAHLAAQFSASMVVLTVPPKVTYANCYNCSSRVAELVRLGVRRDRIRVLATPAAGTYPEALACRRLADETRIHRLLVVTSPYHTRRSLAAFRTAFAGSPVQIGVRPATRASIARPARWWASPDDRWYVGYEWSATLYYMWHYRVFPVLRV
jgi:uncharacterized SAM-binding protein YcdF (DUF218 family)